MAALLIALAICTLTSVPRAESPIDPEALRAIVSEDMHRSTPGCVLGVFRGGRVEVITAAGYADIEAASPIDGDTLFYAASISKQFTALAVAQLVVSGQLSLNDDVRMYLPELPEYEAPITVGMLLHHTAGIANWFSLLRNSGLGPAPEVSREVALGLLFAEAETAFSPGTRFEYSNGGYLLLSEIIARVSGQSFAAYARDHILAPLGMRSSYFLDGDHPDGPRLARGYVRVDGGFEPRDTYPAISGSGGLMLTMNDLACARRPMTDRIPG